MRQVVYIDVLIGLNLFVNYFILLATGKFLNSNQRRWRLVLGALLGGVFSLAIFFPDFGLIPSLLIKLGMSALIVLVSFKLDSFLHFCKLLAVFFSVTFGFGGVVFLIWVIGHSSDVMMNNGVVYFDISPIYLLAGAVISYAVIRIINRLTGRGKPKEMFADIKIIIGGTEINTGAKVDTGNTLHEPFSGYPAIVVSRDFLLKELPLDMACMVHRKSECFSAQTGPADDTWDNRFRLIPYGSVGGNGMLCGLKPDKVVIGQRAVENVYLAVSPNSVSADGYAVLLNLEILE